MAPALTGITLALLTLPLLSTTAIAVEKPGLMLAENFQGTNNLTEFWVSEKLDGIRAYWDGTSLTSRSGNLIHAPEWFIKKMPPVPMDGELWVGRGQFEQTLSTVSKLQPVDSEWRQVKYMAFDLPRHLGSIDDRQLALQTLLHSFENTNLKAVKQFKVLNQNELEDRLEQVIAQGGEGLMLHRGSSLYQAQRSEDLQKLKLAQDAEAKVIAQLPGKGKYSGMMGALLVEMESGIRFRIGSGFTVSERQDPPSIGSVITYRYRGKTRNNIPRFATFLRMKASF